LGQPNGGYNATVLRNTSARRRLPIVLGTTGGHQLKRDPELIRKLALAVEDVATGYVHDEIEIDGYSKDQIGYRAYLLVDAGLAKGLGITAIADTSPRWRIIHLASSGHDFADAARDESTRRKAAGIVKDKAGGVTLDVMKQVLTSVIKNTPSL
jgi:hypothetical protein